MKKAGFYILRTRHYFMSAHCSNTNYDATCYPTLAEAEAAIKKEESTPYKLDSYEAKRPTLSVEFDNGRWPRG